MLVSVHATTVDGAPLKVTVLACCVTPKSLPSIVTVWPTVAGFGLVATTTADRSTVNCGPPSLLAPLTVTTICPDVAAVGTFNVIVDDVASRTIAELPLSVTVGVPGPKSLPAIVTVSPGYPDEGCTDVTVGGGTTVNVTPLLTMPATVTVTAPVVAPAGNVTLMALSLQLDTAATVPLKRTVLVPCVPPKFAPETATV